MGIWLGVYPRGEDRYAEKVLYLSTPPRLIPEMKERTESRRSQDSRKMRHVLRPWALRPWEQRITSQDAAWLVTSRGSESHVTSMVTVPSFATQSPLTCMGT